VDAVVGWTIILGAAPEEAAAGTSFVAVISLVDAVVGWTIIPGAVPKEAAAGVSKALERYGNTDSSASVAEGLEESAVAAGVVVGVVTGVVPNSDVLAEVSDPTITV
jgi:hypothetical protein